MNLPLDFGYQKPSVKPASIDDLFTFKINPITSPHRPGWELTMDVNFSYNNGLLPGQYNSESDKEQVDAFFKDFFKQTSSKTPKNRRCLNILWITC